VWIVAQAPSQPLPQFFGKFLEPLVGRQVGRHGRKTRRLFDLALQFLRIVAPIHGHLRLYKSAQPKFVHLTVCSPQAGSRGRNHRKLYTMACNQPPRPFDGFHVKSKKLVAISTGRIPSRELSTPRATSRRNAFSSGASTVCKQWLAGSCFCVRPLASNASQKTHAGGAQKKFSRRTLRTKGTASASMNWPRVVRCTAAGIGTMFLVATAGVLVLRLINSVL
jgi:hypothetical protein